MRARGARLSLASYTGLYLEYLRHASGRLGGCFTLRRASGAHFKTKLHWVFEYEFLGFNRIFRLIGSNFIVLALKNSFSTLLSCKVKEVDATSSSFVLIAFFP